MNLAEGEALSLLVEECGETIHIIGKCLRHGLDSYNPYDNAKTPNTQLLEHEIGDVLAAIDILEHVGVISRVAIEEARGRKLSRINEWLHHIELPNRHD